MNYILDGFSLSIKLLISLDSYIYGVIFLTLFVSCTSVIISSILGIPLGLFIANTKSRFKNFIITIFNTLLGLPTVVIGLILYALLSRRGPLGFLELLFSPSAIIIGEIILALPIIVALSIGLSQKIDVRVYETLKILHATKSQTLLIIFKEYKAQFILIVLTSFGRVITELGSSLIVGGNIKGLTRTLSGAITLETQKGELANAMAFGIALILLSLGVNIIARGVIRE
jgi:tungstate transport system permease protein